MGKLITWELVKKGFQTKRGNIFKVIDIRVVNTFEGEEQVIISNIRKRKVLCDTFGAFPVNLEWEMFGFQFFASKVKKLFARGAMRETPDSIFIFEPFFVAEATFCLFIG